MSDSLDIDPELSALRNELLIGLTKKNFKKPEVLNDNSEEDKVPEDDDLEVLRLEALNAKRIKTQSKLNLFNKVDQIKKNNNIPGRFRYDKESDEEEDDEDEFTLRSHKNSEEYDDSISSKYNYYNPQATATENNKSPEVCNYHFNYQTYRAECSKLMADDAYDPNSIHDRHEPEGFDLRNFLREKAYKHQQESGVRLAEGSTLSTKTNEDGDVVYEQPITQPIDIKNELSKLKGKNYFDYFNNNNRRKNYRMSGRDSHNDYFDHRNSYSNERCQYFNNNNNNKLNRSNSRNEEKHTEDQEPASSDEDESSDDDSASNCKKLRSVVAVISNKTK